jgi:acyl-CoA oxidase
MPATDNGFMRLTHVRVPLSAMLSKFASVTEDGQYKVPVHPKLGYGGVGPFAWIFSAS